MSIKNPSLHDMKNMLGEDDSLAHYGVKGMKWGVRRTDEQLGNTKSSSKPKSSSDGPSKASKAAKAVKERVSQARQNRKEAKAEAKAEEAKAVANATRLSADAERAIAASSKAPHQMSNQEMRDAINRAQQVEQYNKLFGNDKAKVVADLRLEKEYRSLVKELTPEKKSSAQKAIAAATAGFSAYKALNDMSQGALNGAVMKKMGVNPKVDPLDQLTSATKLLKARSENIRAQQEVDRLTPKPTPKNPLITNKPYYSKSGEAHRAYARNAVKDAQDLNKILEDYLKE